MISESPITADLFLALHLIVQTVLAARVLLRPHREPASRIAWIVVIAVLPVMGILAYVLVGETSIGRRRTRRMREVLKRLADVSTAEGMAAAIAGADMPPAYAHLFQVGKTVNGFVPVGGNRAHLLPDSNASIDAMVADIDAARENVHLLFYIWLTDRNGRKMAAALKRAAARGITCRAMADGLGSRLMIASVDWRAMPEIFVSLIYTARRELVISTPYYVPDESMQAALCASARRGVETTITFPARNDSWIVAAASRSYYGDLLAAGVRIFEYAGGLLHTKSLTLDRQVTLIGSANMDRRSFELNYENNILFYDRTLTREIRERQTSYIAQARPITGEMVAHWDWRRRIGNNAIAMLGPVL